MKNTLLATTLALSSLLLLGGCSGKTETVAANPYQMQKSCENLDRSLVKLDEFILMIENTSAFHLEEAAVAYDFQAITVSNNKKIMLRDAKKYRSELLQKYQEKQCPERKTVSK